MEDLRAKVKKSFAWLLIARAIRVLVNAFVTVTLARLLEPRTFGIFSIAGIFVGFTKHFQSLGLAKALIRRPDTTPDHISTLFSINALGSCGLFVLLWASAPLLRHIFHEPDAVPVLRVLALGFLFNPFSSAATAILHRQMDFRAQSKATILFTWFQGITSVTLAWLGWGVWSLVIGHLVGKAIRTLSLALSAGWVPRLRYSSSAARDLAGFGTGMFVTNVAVSVQNQIDYFIVGRWLGVISLGLYERAYRFPEMLVKEFGTMTDRVLFSAYSRIQSEQGRLRAAFKRVLLSVSIPACPTLIGLALVAPAFVHVVFGPKWDGMVTPLQVLCIAGIFRLVSQLSSTLVNALGYVRAEATSRLVSLALTAASCMYASRWGLVGVATAILLVECVIAAALVVILFRVSGLRVASVVQPQIPVMCATIGMICVVALFQQGSASRLGLESTAMLVGSVGLGIFSYVASLYLLRNRQLVELVREVLQDTQPLLQRLWREHGRTS